MTIDKNEIIGDRLFILIIAAFLIFSFILMYISSFWGVGLSPDSMVYIRIADDLRTGSSSVVSQHYPPLYSYLLFLSSLAISDGFISARWTGIIIYLSSIVLLAIILKKSSGQGNGWILAGIFTIFTAPHLFSIYLMAWSEPLFLLLTLAGFYLLAVFFSSGKVSVLIYSAILLAFAFLTRYVGIVPIGTAVLSLIIFSRQPFGERFKSAGIFTIVSFFPMFIWWSWGQMTGEPGSARSLAYHPISVEKLTEGLNEILNWFFLQTPVSWILFSVFLVSYIYLITVCRTTDQTSTSVAASLSRILYLFIPLYLGFLAISISLFDAHTPLDSRILIPVYFFLIPAVVLGLSTSGTPSPLCRLFNFAAFIVVLILLASQILQLQKMVNYHSKNGVGFLSRQWVQSDTLAYMRKMQPGKRLIYTNSPEIIEIHLKKGSQFLPQKESATSKKINEKYQNAMDELRQAMIENDAILVYFYAFSYRSYLPDLPELNNKVELDVLYNGRDGIVLQAHK